jgi:hypothetical protein
MVSLGRAAPTTAAPSLAAISCWSAGGNGSTTPWACAVTAQRTMASGTTASRRNERGHPRLVEVEALLMLTSFAVVFAPRA